MLSASRLDDEIAWYENDGQQNFTAHVISSFAGGAESVFAADVDGDGDIDVLSGSFTDDKIAWYENDGSQSFLERVITTGADGAKGVFAADLDGDGDLDVMSASRNDNTVAWYENDGSANFTAHTVSTDTALPYSVFAADIDGDGDLDLLTTARDDDTIVWHENASCLSTTVTNTNNSGAGSLRDAIICANNSPGTDTIDFNIPGTGPHTIQPLSDLPWITDPVIIDGYTQPGASPIHSPSAVTPC